MGFYFSIDGEDENAGCPQRRRSPASPKFFPYFSTSLQIRDLSQWKGVYGGLYSFFNSGD